MKWLRSLYRSQEDSAGLLQAVRAADSGRPGRYAGWVLLVLSSAPAGQLDLITLRQAVKCLPYYGEMRVLGLASGREEALQLLQRMLGDCLSETGGAELKAWARGLPAVRFGTAEEVLP